MVKNLKINIAEVYIVISSYSDHLCEQLRRQYADFLSSTDNIALKIDIRHPDVSHLERRQIDDLDGNYKLFREDDGYTFWFHGYWGKIDLSFESTVLFADSPSITVVKLLTGLCLSLYLSLREGIIIHGCGIVDDKRGYLFVGESESGKSTIASLAGQRTVLSDEAIIIRKQSGNFKMYGMPWVKGIFGNGTAEPDSIFFLRKDSHMELKSLTNAQSAIKLLSNRFYSNKYMMEKVLELCVRICSKMPCYDMHFVPDKELIWRDINEIRTLSS